MAYPIFVTLLFLLSPLLAFVFIVHGVLTSRRYVMWFGALFALAVGIFVYTLIPDSEMDIYRYYEYMGNLSGLGFGDAIQYIWDRNDPVTYTSMYLISNAIGQNFIPVIFSLLGYIPLFYIITDFQKNNVKTYDWRFRLVLLFLMTTVIVFNTLTGLRFALALSLFLLALYLDVYKKKKGLARLLYVASPLIHASMILMVLLRIGVWLLAKRQMLFYLIVAIAASASSLIVVFSAQLAQLPFLSHLTERAEDYLEPNIPPGFLYPFLILSCVLMLLVIVTARKKLGSFSVAAKLNIAVIIIAIVNINQFVIAFRFATIAKYLFFIVLFEVLKYYFLDGKVKRPIRRLTLIFGSVAIIILGSVAYQIIAFTGVNAEFTWTYPDVLLQNVIQILLNQPHNVG